MSWPSFEPEGGRWENYFAPMAAAIEELARRRHLRLRRYYHDEPVWDLTFLLPAGGAGKVSIFAIFPSEVALRASLRRDDYASAVRTVRRCKERLVGLKGVEVALGVSELVDLLLAKQCDGETTVTRGYSDWWRYSAEEFERMATRGLEVAR
jgi:hypothetical protein